MCYIVRCTHSRGLSFGVSCSSVVCTDLGQCIKIKILYMYICGCTIYMYVHIYGVFKITY